ncbi:hypothetical protein [Roseateles sp. DAIF2]|uniref:hypothetical protein n=1 Tax=Roseateles sp. DAIF2 TaxID=2714952 RepID=UPI00201E28F7|nr:hypothetical protein [Roseateles sp. DAIF2]
MPETAPEALAEAALRALAELDQGQGVALPRLAKKLGLRVSVLLRLYTLMSDAALGGVAGPGWVRLQCEDNGRWLAHLTEAGRGDAQD